MDLSDPSQADDSYQWLSIALQNEIDALNSMGPSEASQAFHDLAASGDMMSMGNGLVINDFSSLNYNAHAHSSQSPGILGCPVSDATQGFNSYSATSFSPSKIDENDDHEQGDEFEHEDSEIGVYEDGTAAHIAHPNRKIKRYAPMTAQQQSTKIQQIQDALLLYQNPVSVDSQHEDTSLLSSKPDSKLGSPVITPHSTPPPKKRGRPCQDSNGKPNRPKKSAKTKEERKRVPSEALRLFTILDELGKPFEEKLEAVIEIVKTDSQRRGSEHDTAIPLADLLNLQAEWKVDHAAKLEKMTAFLEHWGLIPIGGVKD